jgi:hypothetical protein
VVKYTPRSVESFAASDFLVGAFSFVVVAVCITLHPVLCAPTPADKQSAAVALVKALGMMITLLLGGRGCRAANDRLVLLSDSPADVSQPTSDSMIALD